MNEPKHPKEKTPEKKPTPASNHTTQLTPNTPNATSETLFQGSQTPDAQKAALRRMPTAQQHHLMRQMGQVQGNQYAQRLVAQMHPTAPQQQTPNVQAAPAPAPTVIGTATILAGALNVRSSPQFEGKENIVGKLNKDAKVDVVEKGGNYLKIPYNGSTAYITSNTIYITYTGKPAPESKGKDDNKDKPEKRSNIFQSAFNWIGKGIKGIFNWIGGGIKKLGEFFAGGGKKSTTDNKSATSLEEMLKTLESIQAEDTKVKGEKSYTLWSAVKKKGEAETEKSLIDNSSLHKETELNQATKAVELIKKAREIVGALTVADTGGDEQVLTQIKADYYRRLNKLSPYYTQIANKAILTEKGDRKGAWWRTCNVTSLSMALNALGISPADFQGDKELLKKIAQQLGVPQDQLNSLASWRMADFTQLAAVYYSYVNKNGIQFDATKVENARAIASQQVTTTMSILGGIGKLFGATYTEKSYSQTYGTQDSETKKLVEKHQGRIKTLNAEIATVQGEIAQLAKEGPAELVVLNGETNYQVWKKPDSADRIEYEKQRAERTAQVTSHTTLKKQYDGKKEGEKPALATVKDADEKIVAADGIMAGKLQNEIDKRLPDELQSFKDNDTKIKAFKNAIIRDVGSKMNNGDQVYANVPGHYVRIEDINENGIVIDDPAWGKNRPLTWKETYNEGYFRYYHILSK
ncbi:MAG: SH3 domain-containing protein [Anaerolineae bacterium]|nr:SH3 domain-containing protein [Anaerolineae bacterium]